MENEFLPPKELDAYEHLKIQGQESLTIDPNHALLLFKKALKIVPENPEAYKNVGLAHFYLKNIKKSNDYYLKALEKDCNYWQAYHNLGVNFQTSKLYKSSLEYFQKAAQLAPDKYFIYLYLGTAYSELNEHQEAQKCFQKALELEPNKPSVFISKAKDLIKHKDYANAITLLEEVLPKTQYEYIVDVYFCLGFAYLKNKDYQQAILFLDKAQNLAPDYSAAHEYLALAYYLTDDFNLSFNHYKKAALLFQEKSTSEAMYDLMPKDKFTTELHDKIIEYILSLSLSDSQSENAYCYLGIIHNLKEQFDKAVCYLKKSIDVNPKSSMVGEIYFNLGMAYGKLGFTNDAIDAFLSAINENPNDAMSINVLSEMYAYIGEVDLAKEYAEKATDLNT